jgi:hypothetical protein
MRHFGLRSRAGRAFACLLAAAVLATNSLALAATTPTATPTPAGGFVPCTLFTSFEVHDGEVYAKSTANPNDQGREVRAGYAITFACGALPTITATQAATSGLLIGGTIAGILLGLGLGVAAATGAFDGGSGGGPPPPATKFK